MKAQTLNCLRSGIGCVYLLEIYQVGIDVQHCYELHTPLITAGEQKKQQSCMPTLPCSVDITKYTPEATDPEAKGTDSSPASLQCKCDQGMRVQADRRCSARVITKGMQLT